MPHSLVLNLLPQSLVPPQFLTGRHLHALFLTLVSSVDKELGDHLHDSTADKAFTLSPLQISNTNSPLLKVGKGRSKLQWEHQQPIPAGISCCWRISLLDDTLFGKLTQLWLNLNPRHPWHLGPADLYITSIQGTPQSIQPWANASSYAQLYEVASESDRTIHFNFCTPTAFRQGQYDTTLPTRESVFNSLLSRWNKYSGIEFSHIAIESIFPSFINIHTEILADSRSKFIGIIGEVSYRVLGEIEPIQIKQINALADFALYAGIGRKTPMGMGMARRLYHP
ncbi:MAG: CRISPR-associated endoribonuclease Cas6 [Komarekiella atlantica HA4396-MV6]|jgi:CRISPR-associated endoribonuclease Cas6|nr:CRISPR-associated endoribonuclease Cas6 [Komarekiella atlantica HA4396-MV6]